MGFLEKESKKAARRAIQVNIVVSVKLLATIN